MSFIFDNKELMWQLIKAGEPAIKKKAQQATDPQALAILQIAKKLSLNLKNTIEPGSVNVSPISLSSGASSDIKPENLRSFLDFLNWILKNGVMWNGNKIVSDNETDIPNGLEFENDQRKDDVGNLIHPDKYYVDKTNLVNLLIYLRDSEETKGNKVLEVMLGKIIDNVNQNLQPKEQISKQPQEKSNTNTTTTTTTKPDQIGKQDQTNMQSSIVGPNGQHIDPATLQYLAEAGPFNSNAINFTLIKNWLDRYLTLNTQAQQFENTVNNLIQTVKQKWNIPGDSILTQNLNYTTVSMNSSDPSGFANALRNIIVYTGTAYNDFFQEYGQTIQSRLGEALYRSVQQQISGASPYTDNLRVIDNLIYQIREEAAKNTR